MRPAPIHLRPFRVEDLADYARWLQPGHRWQDTDGPDLPRPTPTDIDQRIESLRGRIASGAPSQRRVIAETASDSLIGTVNWYRRRDGPPALGIGLYPDSTRGRGWGTLALRLWTALVFVENPSFDRLALHTWSGNVAMIRAAERAGFELVAQDVGSRVIGGDLYDGLRFERTRRA